MQNTDKLLLSTTRSIYKHFMLMRQRSHILAAMMEWGCVMIYSPCMSRHAGVNISRGECLMHWAMDVHEHFTASTKPVKSLPFSAWGGTCTYSPACVVQALHSRSYLPGQFEDARYVCEQAGKNLWGGPEGVYNSWGSVRATYTDADGGRRNYSSTPGKALREHP